jgi:hypothetical protein
MILGGRSRRHVQTCLESWERPQGSRFLFSDALRLTSESRVLKRPKHWSPSFVGRSSFKILFAEINSPLIEGAKQRPALGNIEQIVEQH